MAKTTGPLLSIGASGTIAKTQVYSKWKGRPYARRHVTPANPQSTEQTKTRDVFSVANAMWKSAPTLFQAPWDLFATGQVLTGRNAFISKYVKTLRGQALNSTMIFSPGAKGGLAPTAIAIVASAGTLTVGFTNPATPTGWTLTSAIAACLFNQDPTLLTDLTVTAAEDAVTMNSVALTGLTAAQLYTVGAWLKWTKPDGTFAYGASILGTGTPT